jgi:hypothetical protein
MRREFQNGLEVMSRSRKTRFTLGLLFATAALLVSPQLVLALKTHLALSSIQVPGKEPTPTSVAVNSNTHHIYVNNIKADAIFNFQPNGELDPLKPQLTGAGGLRPEDLAVDNSGGSHAGAIYAVVTPSKLSEGFVQQFAAAGSATAVRMEGSAIPPEGTPQSGGLPNVVNNGSFEPLAVAVGPTGDVYVMDLANRALDRFTPEGTFASQLAAGTVPANATKLAVDATGEILVATTNGYVKFTTGGLCVNACTPFGSQWGSGIALNSSGNVLVAETNQSNRIGEYDAAGTLLSLSGADRLAHVEGVAVDGSGSLERIYVSNIDVSTEPFTGEVVVFGPLVTLPDATTEAVTEVGSATATFHGTVGADSGPGVTCVFQYQSAPKFQKNGFAGAQSAPCQPGGPFTGAGSSVVGAEVSGLNGGTEYHYRLVATNESGATPGEDIPFTTEGPGIVGEGVSNVGETVATLEASIEPRGNDTRFHFQLVDAAKFAESGFANAIEVPAGGASVGSAGLVPIVQAITGLAPGIQYHIRVVAENSTGTNVGPEVVFLTFPGGTASLPDGRVYEQVSPLDKNGANVQGETNAVQAAAGGNRIAFYANAGLAGGEGAQAFPSYVATRASDGSGWSTEGLLPPAATGPFGKVIGWSQNLSQAYLSNKLPAESAALYVRTLGQIGVRQAAVGGKERLGYFIAAESADGRYVLFEHTSAALTEDAITGKPNAYIWDRESGEVHLAGLFNTNTAPKKGTFAGSYDWYKGGDPSAAGGAARRYYGQAAHAISDDGSRAFFTAVGTGQVYLRQNPLREQSPLQGGVCTNPELACTYQISTPEVPDPNGEKPAAFVGASVDGSSAFIISSGRLTADATTGSSDAGADLYQYDASTHDLTDLTPDAAATNGAEVQGVLGISDDGSYVYFAANGSLAPGATQGDCKPGTFLGSCNVYLAHDGVITFIARLAPGGPRLEEIDDALNWEPTAELPGSGVREKTARLSHDGRTLLFQSSQQLTGYESHGLAEIYRYQSGHPGLICVSCNPTGASPAGSAKFQNPTEPLTGPKLPYAVMTRNLSENGNRVFFETADKLVSADTNGVEDVYEWEAPGEGTCVEGNQGWSPRNGGCIYLISTGTSPFPSHFADASADGNDAFFFTAQSLVKKDRDGLVDIYDARVGGGIPEAPEPVPCASVDSCAGAATFAPPTRGAGSTVSGAGNPKTLKCRAGFRRVVKKGKERCTKVKHHRKKHKHKSGKKHKHKSGKKHKHKTGKKHKHKTGKKHIQNSGGSHR